jgi:hypothetical protein
MAGERVNLNAGVELNDVLFLFFFASSIFVPGAWEAEFLSSPMSQS